MAGYGNVGDLNRRLAEHFSEQCSAAVPHERVAGYYLQYSGDSFYLVENDENGVEKKRTEVPRSALPVLRRFGLSELRVEPVGGIESKLVT